MYKGIILPLILLVNFKRLVVLGQRYVDDSCVDRRTNENGVCKLLNDCEEAKANIKKRIYPTQCGFRGNDIIICCKATTLVTIKTRQPGEISNQKCKDYSQYVWTRELNPTLLINGEDLMKRDCPFNRLELVVGGEPASRKEFPHMVQLGYDEEPIRWACGGTLISEQYVLTACHCLEDRSLGEALYARMGLIDIDNPDNVQQFNIIERIYHPQYEEPSHYHDIGLAKLHKKADLNSFVRPACLYTTSTSPWTKVIAAGFGKTTYGGDESTVLLRVVLELYDQAKCDKVYKHEKGNGKLQDGIKDDLMICAGHSEDLKDTCQGDSGGPLQVYRVSQDKNMSCMYDIIGVTSFGKGCGLAVDIPGVYTRVSHYLKWIEDIVWPIN